MPPPMIGHYQIERMLGKGSMGIVYLGLDPGTHREVAIKTLSLGKGLQGQNRQSAKQRFFQAAKYAKCLNHPNIASIYAMGEDRDLAYIAMERLQGHDLQRYTINSKEKPLLPVPLVIEIIAKVAMALHYAHKNNIVHCDIKPTNIMFDPKTTTIKITDFGIARLTVEKEKKNSSCKVGNPRRVAGTPYYMSPEQIIGEKVDGRSDLFSLGILFFNLLTGCLPFPAREIQTLLIQISHEPHQNMLALRPTLPACLGKIMDSVLQKDSTKRYQTGLAMVQDLVLCVRQCQLLGISRSLLYRPECV